MEPDDPEPLQRPDCALDQDGRIWITLGAAERLRDCNIPPGAILSLSYEAERPHHKARKRKEKRTMEPLKSSETAAPSASSTIPAETPVQATPEKEAVVAQVVDDGAATPVEVIEVVEQPAAPAGFDPMAMAQENPMLAFALAALAVVGGGAGFKLWTKMSEQRHETKMKELELEAQKAGLNGAQPPPCQVKQTETDAKLASLEARVKKAEKAASAVPAGFDGEELEKRVVKLEAAMKRMGVKAPGGDK